MNWMATILAGVAGHLLMGVVVTVAVTLWPRQNPFRSQGLTAAQHRAIEVANGVVFEQNFPFRRMHFKTSDGASIAARLFGPDTARDLIVLVHGIGAAGERWNNPAGLLSETARAQTVVVDLRGHNQSSGRRYDLDRFGQYEDDLAEIISTLARSRPESRIWLAGHSMGGGIALRYALKTDRPRLSGYLLFAPYFGQGPTEPKEQQSESVLHIDRLRITGLILFNMLGIEAFNHLPVAHLNVPPEFPSYTFRAIASGLPMPPQKAEDGLAAMEGKVLVIAGDRDIAVHAPGYKQVAAPFSHVQIEILPGHGHDSVLNARETHDLVGKFMRVPAEVPENKELDARASSASDRKILARE